MQIRVLKPEEEALLKGTPLERIDLQSAEVAVALTDAGETVGTMALAILPHLEGPWIREDCRRGTLLKRLESILFERAQAFGIPRIFAYADRPEMEDYIARLGYQRTPWTVWEKEASNVSVQE